jgi:hypothetical protein
VSDTNGTAALHTYSLCGKLLTISSPIVAMHIKVVAYLVLAVCAGTFLVGCRKVDVDLAITDLKVEKQDIAGRRVGTVTVQVQHLSGDLLPANGYQLHMDLDGKRISSQLFGPRAQQKPGDKSRIGKAPGYYDFDWPVGRSVSVRVEVEPKWGIHDQDLSNNARSITVVP